MFYAKWEGWDREQTEDFMYFVRVLDHEIVKHRQEEAQKNK